jgi:hypothetical protein
MWRQHRMQVLVATVLLVCFAILLMVTGTRMEHDYVAATATCHAGPLCGDFTNGLFNGDGAIIDVVNLTVLLPVVLGLFLGAPLIAREAETTTNVLAWTQSVTRKHWVRTKLAVMVVATALLAAAVSGLVTWWSRPENSLFSDRFDPAKFDIQGVVPVAFAVFAVCVGIAVGTVIRRTVPALGISLAIFVAIRLVVSTYVRPHYLTPLRTFNGLAGDSNLPSGSWVISTHITLNGHVTGPVKVTTSCLGSGSRQAAAQCLSKLGYGMETIFQPGGRYWHFQWVEAGLFLLLAAGLLAFAYRYTLRRDA